MSVEMSVSGLMLDPLTNAPIVILKSVDGEHVLPIWIGPFEAQAIAMHRDRVTPPRPMTHDLMRSLLKELHTELQRIVIHDLRESTFYAYIELLTESGATLQIDSRPSDAIALAIRADSPIYVEPLVFTKSRADDAATSRATLPEEGDEERLRSWFESVDPDDFSKYKM